jgi:uncharacterized protein (TIGR03083 family)
MRDNSAAQAGGWGQRGRQATEALRETWASLAEVCHDLVTQEWGLPTECPGWDVKDQLSHVIGIERSLLGEPAPEWDGPMGDHVKNEFSVPLEKWIAVRRAESGPTVLAEFSEVTAARLAVLEAMGDEQWAVVGFSPVGEVPYAEFMDLRVYDCWVHEQDVRRALDRPGGSGGLASSIGIDRVESAMGFVVGKRAASPDGAVVRFEVAGPGPDDRCFTIAVTGGRAKATDEDLTPTVRLSMSSLDFVRLGCGRATAEQVQAAGGIGMEGDSALGQKILGSMNFMF